MSPVLEFWPPAALALNEEVQNHPVLLAALSDLEKNNGGRLDMALMLGCVAAYCNIVLDGYYMEEDLELLFHLLIKKLKEKGTVHIH